MELEMWVVDVDCEAVGGGDIFVGARVVDVGCKVVDGDVAHDTVVNFSPSAASPTSPVTCSSILAAFPLPFEFPGSFVSVLYVEVGLNE